MLVETADEVLAQLHGIGARLGDHLRERLAGNDANGHPAAPRADPDYTRLLAAIDHSPVALDELAARSGLSASALSSMLLVLELDGTIVGTAGRYALKG